MKTFLMMRNSAALLLCFISSNVFSQNSTCDGIAEQVTAAVTKEPSRVLMIVEDALVINEKCACEIIRAAILGSKADAELSRSIVQTAISVTPKMSAVIMDCANLVSPEIQLPNSKTTVQSTGKEVKNPVFPIETRDEEYFVPASIRGVYLMQPPAGGFLPRACDKDCISPTQSIPSYP